ncbi:MAG: hypothetical protein JNL58_04720 [Planctomyces sp.]|nr:hypothetical protein [Planctomyces sp.]
MSKAPPGSPPTVAIAFAVFLLMASGFIALLSIVIPGAGLMVLAALMLGLMFAAQYFIWGKWLYKYVVEKERKELELQAAHTDKSNQHSEG